MRDLISKVRPRDLLDSVRRLAERFTGPDFTVWVTAEDPAEQLPAVIEQEAYRIVSEALTNVSKHANARNCWIVISRTTDLLVSITDDGTGIPSAAVNGVGLESMRRRCEDLGGEFDIVSQPGKTRIQACLPLGRD